MSWRTVVVTKPSKLDLRLGYLVVRDSESTVRVHINEISVLIIETTQSSITTALISELVKQKVNVIFCDEKENPVASLISEYGSYDTSLKLRIQINWICNNKQSVWTNIVNEKIKNQALNLEYFNLPESEKLYEYMEQLEFNDESNREGHAAKVYFNSLFGKSFSRSDECPINAMLNYGYSIILSCFNREVVTCGYSTKLGIFHDNMYNNFNLSCDLMEPFRPIVDRIVKKLNPTKFEHEEKIEVLSILSKEFLIDDRRQTLLNTIKIYTKSVLEAIETGDMSVIKFYKYEL